MAQQTNHPVTDRSARASRKGVWSTVAILAVIALSIYVLTFLQASMN